MFKCGNTSTQSGSSHSSNRYRLLEGYSLVLVSNICLYSLLPGEMIKEMNKSTKNERMPPENLWLEDVFFLLKMVPFSRGSTCFFWFEIPKHSVVTNMEWFGATVYLPIQGFKLHILRFGGFGMVFFPCVYKRGEDWKDSKKFREWIHQFLSLNHDKMYMLY